MLMHEIGFWFWMGFRLLLPVALAVLALLCLDDLWLDLRHWFNRLFGKGGQGRAIKPLTREQLEAAPEKPAAILVPVWNEAQAIGRMLLNTLSSLSYRNYHLFVGAYPNDEATKLEVEKVREVYPNIEVVVMPADGPTSKSDCLNWLYQGVLLHEQQRQLRFSFLVFHDAGDVIHPLALKYCNYLFPRVEIIQMPVFPLAEEDGGWTAGVARDEYAEQHAFDMRARELWAAAIPSPGTGTAVSRDALEHLAQARKNQIFDMRSLSATHRMGQLLRDAPGKKIFLLQQLEQTLPRLAPAEAVTTPVATWVSVESGIRAALRLKARWVMDLARRNWSPDWSQSLGLNYCLWRDRKLVGLSAATSLALLCLLYGGLTALGGLLDSGWAVPPLLTGSDWYAPVAPLAAAALAWRLGRRAAAVRKIYGPTQGWLAIPRFLAASALNLVAALRARARLLRATFTAAPEWEKAGSYPSGEQLQSVRRRLGDLLLEKRLITTAQLESAMQRQKAGGGKLGDILIEMGALWEEDLVQALARQRNETAVEIDAAATPLALLQLVPKPVAERYRVYPLDLREGALTLATDAENREQVSQELQVLLSRPVQLRPAATPDLDYAIARSYGQQRRAEPSAAERLGDRLVRQGLITTEDLIRALRNQKRTNRRLGEILVDMKLLSATDLEDGLQKP